MNLFFLAYIRDYLKPVRQVNEAKDDFERLGFGWPATLLEKPNEIKEPEDNSIPLILYIRSFKEDDDDSDGLGHIENRLYNSFKNIGSVTAIGKPGRFEKNRRINKYYFDDNTWKEKAKELIEKSYRQSSLKV